MAGVHSRILRLPEPKSLSLYAHFVLTDASLSTSICEV
jgi:hypothetical protein